MSYEGKRFEFMNLFEEKAIKIRKYLDNGASKEKLQSGSFIYYTFENGFEFSVYKLLASRERDMFWVEINPKTEKMTSYKMHKDYNEQEVLEIGKKIIKLKKSDYVAEVL